MYIPQMLPKGMFFMHIMHIKRWFGKMLTRIELRFFLANGDMTRGGADSSRSFHFR